MFFRHLCCSLDLTSEALHLGKTRGTRRQISHLGFQTRPKLLLLPPDTMTYVRYPRQRFAQEMAPTRKVYIMYNEGISRSGDVLDLAVEMDIVDKHGSFYNYNDERIAQGRENSKDALRQNPALLREIENTVREANGLPALPVIEQTPASV